MSATKRPNRKLPTINAIIDYWSEVRKSTGQLPFCNEAWEWDAEPYCWTCGWDKGSTLDRCHVVPRMPLTESAPAGLDNSSNLVLMCKSCHKRQPQSSDPEATFQWMRNSGQGLMGLIASSPLLSSQFVSWSVGTTPVGCMCDLLTDEIRTSLQRRSNNEFVPECPVHDLGATFKLEEGGRLVEVNQ